MSSESFFTEQEEHSTVKSTIVEKYFSAWAGVVKQTALQYITPPRIAYIDLFAGPGRYEDGAESTPLKVLKTAIQDSTLRDILVTIFNDKDEDKCQSLDENIGAIEGIATLKYEPKIFNHEVGTEIVNLLKNPDAMPDLFYRDTRRGHQAIIPTLFFIDPFGYKGLSLQLINSVIQFWGCDVIVFFNYNRINMGISNPIVRDHMAALFGNEQAQELELRVRDLAPDEREIAIVEAISESLKALGASYILPFRFRNDTDTRTKHHLIFASKHIKGYNIMKDVMAKESSDRLEGVPTFEYNPATERQPILLEYARPLAELADMLLNYFQGKTLTVKQIFERHHVGRRFVRSNYVQVLLGLERDGKITITSPRRRTSRGLGDDSVVKFASQ